VANRRNQILRGYMRILDPNTDKAINEIGIFLTLNEAKELRDKLERLIDNPSEHHNHIEDAGMDPMKELTVAIYTHDNMRMFDERSRKLIEEDK